MSEKIVHATDENFETEVLQADKPVLVDFWAEWCGPCKMIAPLIEDAANDYGDKLKVVKVDVENAPQAQMKYGVRSIPTLMVFKAGAVEATKVGAINKGQLTDFIDGTV